MANILISGGSGLIGRALSRQLLSKGHEVRWLSRKKGLEKNIRIFKWDPDAGSVDVSAFEKVTHLVHLAGAGIVDKRWTKKYKQELADSRVRSAELLGNTVLRNNINLEAFVGASAVGYYSDHNQEKIFSETDPPGNDFLARLCIDWERSYKKFADNNLRTAVVRTSVVLSRDGGTLKKLLPLFRLGLGSAVGTGTQPFPWIHISDLVAVYSKLLFDASCSGPYNATADEQVSNKEFSKRLAKSLHRPFLLPPVPEFVLRIVMGEAGSIVTKGQKVSNLKLKSTGFHLEFPTLKKALDELMGKSQFAKSSFQLFL